MLHEVATYFNPIATHPVRYAPKRHNINNKYTVT